MVYLVKINEIYMLTIRIWYLEIPIMVGCLHLHARLTMSSSSEDPHDWNLKLFQVGDAPLASVVGFAEVAWSFCLLALLKKLDSLYSLALFFPLFATHLAISPPSLYSFTFNRSRVISTFLTIQIIIIIINFKHIYVF